jgi:hypothetical protein
METEVLREEELEITVRGSETAVRRALDAMRFEVEWDQGVARSIALDETGIAEATLDDELGKPPINMFAEEVRLNYRDRCCDRAAERGHPVANPDNVASGAASTVMQVGDTLFASAT